MYYSCRFLLLPSLLGLDQCFSNSDTRTIARWYERKFRIFFFQKLKFRNLNCTIIVCRNVEKKIQGCEFHRLNINTYSHLSSERVKLEK